MKRTRIIGIWCIAWMALFASQVHAQESLCAVVKIEIAQELTLERQAFEANMRITNSLDSMPLENININIEFEDSDGNTVVASSNPSHSSAAFFISLDAHNNISSLSEGDDGAITDGVIDPTEVGELRWLIVPTVGAGGDDGAGRLYYVGASLSFTYGGESQTIEVAPDTIVVKPQPNLVLDYFLPSEVNGDNPFTSEIEPVEPYNLGVRVANTGSGASYGVKIESAQPKIVENELGLLVDFLITGSFVDDAPANKTLLLNFGTIPAQSNTTGRWIMETSLTGRFTEFNASFTHADEFGGELTSLIEAVNSHFLLHDVTVDLPGRDAVRDFLAQDGNSVRVYESEHTGTNQPDCSDCLAVTSLAGSLGSVVTGGSGINRTLSTTATSGPVHIKVTDPYEGSESLTSVVRSDGKVLSPTNYWLSKTIQDDKIHYDYFLNVFDTTGGSSYTLTFGGHLKANEPPVIQHIANYTTYETGQVGFLVQASDPNKTTPSLSALNLPAGATFQDKSNGQGVLSWFPQVGQAGTYVLEFSASDGELSANQTAKVVVFPDTDRDGDGMDDAWEIEHFGDLSRDGTGDFDGDGITDKDEFLRDADPTVAELAPAEPQLAKPAYGAEVTSLMPTLQVTNGAHDANIGSVDYTFEVYEDESMTRQVAVATGVPEGEGTTEVVIGSGSYAGGTLNDNTEYFWRANARTAAGASEWVNGRFFVNTENDAPAAFTVSKPSDQTLVDTLTPTLVTNNSADIDGDALTYQFQVFAEDDADFTNPVAQVSGLAQGAQGQTAWTVSTPLINGQLYFWIAVATDEHGASTVSEPATFIVSTSNLAPGAPTVVSPMEGEVVMGNGATLVVGNARDPERRSLDYWFEIDEVNTFDSPALQTSGTVAEGVNGETSWSATGLREGQRYYWRAKADDGAAQGPWVTASFSMYIDAQPPGTPTLDNPADQAWVEVLTPALSVHPVIDPNGDAVSYEFELYQDELLETSVATAVVDAQTWSIPAPLQNHQYYYWRARAVDAGGLASGWSSVQRFFTNKDGIDDAPTLSFVLPDTNVDTYGGNIEIQWVDQDPDSDARISLYYNDTNLIVSDLPESADGEGDRYSWNIDSLPVGTYALSAVIEDNTSSVRVDACCVIRKSDREIAARVTPVTEAVTDEYGVTDAEFDVVLDDAPRAGTSVLLNLSVSDAGEGRILNEQAYLEFTPDNWSVPQKVWVRGRDDCEIDGTASYHLQFSPAVSADPTFEGTLTPAVEIVNRDNEAAGQSLFICSYELLSQQADGGNVRYQYRVRLKNTGLGIRSATAQGQSLSQELTLVSGSSLSFPAVGQGSSAWSEGSVTVTAPAGVTPNLAALDWTIQGEAPSIVSSAPSEAMDGQEYTYQVIASGQPGDVFTFTLLGAPEGMTVDPATGLIEWVPDMDQQGRHTVVVEVRDQLGGVSQQTFVVDVSPNGSIARVYTVDPSPDATADFASLANAVAALPETFVRPIVIRARSSSGAVDTNPVRIDNAGTNAEMPLSIILEGGYQLTVDAAAPGARAISLAVPHVSLAGEGGRIILRNNGFDEAVAVEVTGGAEGSDVFVDRLTIRGDITGTPARSAGILVHDAVSTVVVRNNEVSGFTAETGGYGLSFSGRTFAYNNTLVNNQVGLVVNGATGALWNNLSVNNERDYLAGSGEWPAGGNNLSLDGTSPQENFRERTVEFVDAQNSNYELAPWDTSAVGQGADLSAISQYPFAVDLRMEPRQSPWDIGAHTVGEVSNWPPFIDSDAVTLVEQGDTYEYAVVATDNDGDTLTYALATAPQGMSIDADTGVIQWAPSDSQVGDYPVSVEVSDGRGGMATQEFELIVSPAGSNGARLVTVNTDPSAGADYTSLQAALAAESGEMAHPLLIRAQASTGLVDTTPVVIDGFNTSVEKPMTIVLEAGYQLQIDALQAGVYGIRIRDNHVTVRGTGGSIWVRNNGYDAVGGVIVEQQEPGSTVVLDALRIAGTVTGDPVRGSGIEAADPDAVYVLRNNIVTGFVGTYVNHGIHTAGPAFVYNNTLVGNRIGLRVEHASSQVFNNLAVNNQTDYVSWANAWSVTGNNVSSDASSPDDAFRNRDVVLVDVGANNFALAPWDTGALGQAVNLSVADHYSFNVDATGAQRQNPWDVGALMVGEVNNWPPFIVSEPKIEARTKKLYSYTVTAEDHDGDSLIYSLVSAPSGMVVDSSSGVINWTPTKNQSGTFEVVVLVEDGFGGSDQQSFSVDVAKTGPNPGSIFDFGNFFDWLVEKLWDRLSKLSWF